MYTLAKFLSYEVANGTLDEMTELARHPTSADGFELTELRTSVAGDFFWFNFGDCVTNAGLATETILSMGESLDLHEFEEIPEDWELRVE